MDNGAERREPQPLTDAEWDRVRMEPDPIAALIRPGGPNHCPACWRGDRDTHSQHVARGADR